MFCIENQKDHDLGRQDACMPFHPTNITGAGYVSGTDHACDLGSLYDAGLQFSHL